MEINVIEEMLKISAAAFAAVEFLKPWLKSFFSQLEELSEDAKRLLYGSISFVIAFVLVLFSGAEVNLFLTNDVLGQQAPLIGKVATAIITGLGPTIINAIGNAAVLRMVTIPRMKALEAKAYALQIAETNGNQALIAEVRAQKI